jgi:hypothetical protein
MVHNQPVPSYEAYKLYRSSEWDAYAFKGKIDGKWRTIYSWIEPTPGTRAMILANYGVDIASIPVITRGT